jgi:hypothetical protein
VELDGLEVRGRGGEEHRGELLRALRPQGLEGLGLQGRRLELLQRLSLQRLGDELGVDLRLKRLELLLRGKRLLLELARGQGLLELLSLLRLLLLLLL